MILKQGTRVRVLDKEEDVEFDGYFQGFNVVPVEEGSMTVAVVSDEGGNLFSVSLSKVKMLKDQKDNVIREFIEHALHGSVAPTSLINKANGVLS